MIKLLSLLTSFATASIRGQGCLYDVTSLSTSSQFLVLSNSTSEIVYPPPDNSPSNRSIPLSTGNSVTLSCPTGYFLINQERLGDTLSMTCNSDSLLEINNIPTDFNSITCSSNHLESVRSTNETCNSGEGVVIEIGFQVSLSVFLVQNKICYSHDFWVPIYTVHEIDRSGIKFFYSYLLNDWTIQDREFYSPIVDLDEVYDDLHEQAVINRLVGLPLDSKKYINSRLSKLQPRLLTGTPSFLYFQQQKSNYRYINSVPMWSQLYNWNKIEDDVRGYSTNNSVNLQIFTGTYGTLQLPHEETGRNIEIFLDVTFVNGEKLPVPQLFWRVVYEATEKKAVTILMINNPFFVSDAYVICNDISAQISWLSWERNNLERGIGYVCTYEDLKKRIPDLPPIDVEGVLL